jgi:hypothetical protein
MGVCVRDQACFDGAKTVRLANGLCFVRKAKTARFTPAMEAVLCALCSTSTCTGDPIVVVVVVVVVRVEMNFLPSRLHRVVNQCRQGSPTSTPEAQVVAIKDSRINKVTQLHRSFSRQQRRWLRPRRADLSVSNRTAVVHKPALKKPQIWWNLETTLNSAQIVPHPQQRSPPSFPQACTCGSTSTSMSRRA